MKKTTKHAKHIFAPTSKKAISLLLIACRPTSHRQVGARQKIHG